MKQLLRLRNGWAICLLLTLVSCMQETELVAPSNELSVEVSKIKDYFEENVYESLKSNSSARETSIIWDTEKDLQWYEAYFSNTNDGKALYIPVKYEQELRVPKGNKSISFDNLTYVLIKPGEEGLSIELVTTYPDFNYMASSNKEMPFSGIVEVTDWAGNIKRQFLHRNDSVFEVARPDDNAGWTENCVQVPIYGWITTSYVGGPGNMYPSSQRWGILDYQSVCSFTQIITELGCYSCETYSPGGGGSGIGNDRQPTIDIDDEDVFPCEEGFILVDNECLKVNISLDLNEDSNICEKLMVVQFPLAVPSLMENRDFAVEKTRIYFSGSLHNTCADAFRHALFNALNTQSLGADVTRLFGDAHECLVPEDKYLEKEMDLFNNAIGRQIGSSNPDANLEQLIILIINAMSNGELRYISNLDIRSQITPNSTLISTSDCF